MLPSRRKTALMLSAVLALAAAPLWAGGAARAEDKNEVSLGSPTAPVTLIEYASVSCPHCARFAADVLPEVKTRYIDTGKVRYVFRALPIHPREDTAGFLLAGCAGPQRYLAVVDALFKAQPALFNGDLHGWLEAGAKAAGLSDEQMRTCISDVAAIQASNERAERLIETDKIDSTPTLIVNGRHVNAAGPEYTFSDIDAAVRPLLGGKSGQAKTASAKAPATHKAVH